MDNIFEVRVYIILFTSIVFFISYFSFCYKFKYLKSITYSFILISLLFLYLNYKFLNFDIYFLLSSVFLLNIIYIFSVVIYTPKSSIRFKILNLIYENNGKVRFSKLKKKYNDQKIFKKRYKRLQESQTIKLSKKKIYISSLRGNTVIMAYLLLKKLINT